MDWIFIPRVLLCGFMAGGTIASLFSFGIGLPPILVFGSEALRRRVRELQAQLGQTTQELRRVARDNHRMQHQLHESRVAAANLRKTPQHEPGDQVVVDGLVSVEGQTLNGLHGTVSPGLQDNALARDSSSLLRAGGLLQRRELRRQHR